MLHIFAGSSMENMLFYAFLKTFRCDLIACMSTFKIVWSCCMRSHWRFCDFLDPTLELWSTFSSSSTAVSTCLLSQQRPAEPAVWVVGENNSKQNSAPSILQLLTSENSTRLLRIVVPQFHHVPSCCNPQKPGAVKKNASLQKHQALQAWLLAARDITARWHAFATRPQVRDWLCHTGIDLGGATTLYDAVWQGLLSKYDKIWTVTIDCLKTHLKGGIAYCSILCWFNNH